MASENTSARPRRRVRLPRVPSGGRHAPRGTVRAVVAVAALACATLGTVTYGSAVSASPPRTAAAAAAPSGGAAANVAIVKASGAIVKASGESRVMWSEVLEAALRDVSGDPEARYSVAVLDTASGARAVYGDGLYDTASIVKVDILAALLLQAQDAGRDLTAQEKAWAEVMIEYSDNAAATALWRAIGRGAGLDAANRRLGLTSTTPGSGLLWGLTRTTAADQLTLLQRVFGTDGALDAASRGYVRRLMGRVSAAQAWGVPTAADGSYEVKNGWLQRSTTGLWDINSIGRIRAGGRTYLVAVVSRGSTTQAAGITLVERAARAAVRAFSRAAGRSGAP
ncbi:serine hydrolase [Streptomyces sp. NPDC026673]|uniref:serine hydrolase n=1 Tax=Streptomyces sp. NPDC026673 TaxID=3155724 RepID=UPI0033EE73C3